MDGRSRRILPVVPSSSSNPRLCPHAPPLLPALAILLLRPLAPILPEQAPCGAAASAADKPGAATSAPRNRMEAAVWLEDEDGARAAQEQAGSLRRMPSWRAESARELPAVRAPSNGSVFTIDVAQSRAREWPTFRVLKITLLSRFA